MNKMIKILDNLTINKIAAGEVVERPSSVIKELIENAIDAEASVITVEIKEGGKKYIRVTDNGSGINKDDLEIAFLRHTTSKISHIDDLEKIDTLGFRGEALASITAISQVQIITKAVESLIGNQIDIHGGDVISNKEVGCPYGTTIIVKNLFYNIPVRLKFLKSDSAEATNVSDTVYRLALSHPDISLQYIKDNKMIVKTPGNGDVGAVVYSLLGRDFSNSLFKFNYNGDDIKIWGYISKPSYTRGNRNFQYFFVNGRYIKSDMLSKTLQDAYHELIMINRYPVGVIYIELNPSKIDVNVHPTKTEIRFKEWHNVREHLTNTITHTLKKNNLIPKASFDKDKNLKENTLKIIDFTSNSAKEAINQSSNNNYSMIKENDYGKTYNVDYHQPSILDNENATSDQEVALSNNLSTSNQVRDDGDLKLGHRENLAVLSNLKVLGVLFNTYILAEDSFERTFYLIDQHAAHERILYEEYREQFNRQKIATQELLSPEILNLTHGELELMNEYSEVLENLGFTLENFGVNSIIVRSVPVIFGIPDFKLLFYDILDSLSENIKTSYDVRIEKIMKLACTSAIKGGDSIKNMEIDRLIKDLTKAENPYTCPHGRPVIIKMTKYEIEKKFKRIQ